MVFLRKKSNRLLKNGCGRRVWPLASRDASWPSSDAELFVVKTSRAKSQTPQAVAAANPESSFLQLRGQVEDDGQGNVGFPLVDEETASVDIHFEGFRTGIGCE